MTPQKLIIKTSKGFSHRWVQIICCLYICRQSIITMAMWFLCTYEHFFVAGKTVVTITFLNHPMSNCKTLTVTFADQFRGIFIVCTVVISFFSDKTVSCAVWIPQSLFTVDSEIIRNWEITYCCENISSS